MQMSIWDKLLQDGFIGVVAGLVTTIILFGLRTVWTAWLAPRLRELQYDGVNVSGTWRGSKLHLAMTLVLRQSAHTLKGTLHIVHSEPSNPFELVFDVTGRIWEGYTSLSCKPADPEVTSYCACLLKIGGGGVALEGQMVFRDVNNERVSAEPMTVVRDRHYRPTPEPITPAPPAPEVVERSPSGAAEKLGAVARALKPPGPEGEH